MQRGYKGLRERSGGWWFVADLCRFLIECPPGPLVLFVAVLSHGCIGLLCVAYPPQTRNEAAGVSIPMSATCLKVTRHADFSTVEVPVGEPAVQLSTLLRLDGVKGVNGTEKALRFFGQDVVESKTVKCNVGGSCRDAMYLADGTRSSVQLKHGEFAYRHGSLERALYTTASQIRGVSGEFFLREGFNYWLTATHLCYVQESVKASGVPIRVESGTLKSNKDILVSDILLSATPAVQSSGDSCRSKNVSLFPELASLEATWLSISDTGLYSSAPESIEARRVIAEIGVECARNDTSLLRDLQLYELDCSPYSSCSATTSIPFRRLATSSIFISLRTSGDYYIKTLRDDTLKNLPRLANSIDAFYSSILKMAMITLAASVVYVRSRKKTASSSWLFKNCLSISHRHGPLKAAQDEYEENEFEDRAVGLFAIVSRIVVVFVRLGSLSNDHQLRVCVAEFVGAGLSIVHFWLRYGALLHDNEESPISKLGGSTAIVDSTSAVMLAFSETPTLATSSSSFNPTARMLVALLVSIVVVNRCVFSAACCGTLWPTFFQDKRSDYAYMLMFSAVAWCVQCGILAVASCDLFVAPAAYSMSRAMAANADAMFWVRLVLFLSVTAAGLPHFVATSRHILSDKEHVD